MSKRRSLSRIKDLIIHCADTPDGACYCAEDIDDWHRERGFSRSGIAAGNVSPELTAIGYHFVIHVSGSIRRGRSLIETGAHARGYNENSIGICLIGRERYSHAQWSALRSLVHSLQMRFGNRLRVRGHRDVNPGKTCPGFDVGSWVDDGMRIPPPHLYIPEESA